MKKILGLVGSLVGLFVGSILFFLSLNGMLRTKSPFLVAGPGYTAADTLQVDGDSETLQDEFPPLEPRKKMVPSKRLDEIEDASPRTPDASASGPEPAAVRKQPQPKSSNESASQQSNARTSAPAPSTSTAADDATSPPAASDARESNLLQLEAEKFERLVRVYEKMKPKQVALIMDTLPDDQSVAILANMKDRAAAQVMAGMEPQKAARMSRLLYERGGK